VVADYFRRFFCICRNVIRELPIGVRLRRNGSILGDTLAYVLPNGRGRGTKLTAAAAAAAAAAVYECGAHLVDQARSKTVAGNTRIAGLRSISSVTPRDSSVFLAGRPTTFTS